MGDYHINADEPSVLDCNTDFKTANLESVLYAPDEFRISDHDPVIIGLAPNVPPVLSEITVTLSVVALGTAVSVSVSFTDPDKPDTHTATWDWGDGTTSAGIDFRSTSIDWMVVTGTRATARIHGAGTVNGEPGYTFELRATDERKADRVAITISTAGTVFYAAGARPLQGSASIKKAR